MIDRLVDALETASDELLASGEIPTTAQRKKLQAASRNLQNVVDRGNRISAAKLVLHDDGTVTTEYEPATEPVLEVSAEGIEIFAGERLSTALKRKRSEKGMTHGDVAKNLPIGEETYRRIEDGWDFEIPDDVMQGLADHMGMDKQTVARMHELDKCNPVRPLGPPRY